MINQFLFPVELFCELLDPEEVFFNCRYTATMRKIKPMTRAALISMIKLEAKNVIIKV